MAAAALAIHLRLEYCTMRSGDSSNAPNPFAVDLTPRSPRKTRFLAALRVVLVVAAVFAAVVAVGSVSQQWLLQRLTADFAALDAKAKQRRLFQIAELDELGVPHLVHTLLDEDIAVARAAYQLTLRLQTQWEDLELKARCRRHQRLALELEQIALHLPDDRTGWASNLLNNTLSATADREDARELEVHRLANDALTTLALTSRPGPSVLAEEPDSPTAPVRIVRRGRTIPYDELPAESWEWVDGSLSVEASEDTASPARNFSESGRIPSAGTEALTPQTREASLTAADGDGGSPGAVETARSESSSADVGPRPTIYRTATVRLRPLTPDNNAASLATDQTQHSTSAVGVEAAPNHIERPLQTYGDRSVMHWLANNDPALREQARAELARRSYSNAQIAIATQIVSSDLSTRLTALDSISRSTEHDPRPWLLMMVDDANREVRLRAISALATMRDPSIRARLRKRLSIEPDAAVAGRIRDVLQQSNR